MVLLIVMSANLGIAVPAALVGDIDSSIITARPTAFQTALSDLIMEIPLIY